MFRAVLTRALRRLRVDGDGRREAAADRADDADGEADESDGSRFVPSVLDWSVRYGHGGADAEAARELTRVGEEAERLETRTREK